MHVPLLSDADVAQGPPDDVGPEASAAAEAAEAALRECAELPDRVHNSMSGRLASADDLIWVTRGCAVIALQRWSWLQALRSGTAPTAAARL